MLIIIAWGKHGLIFIKTKARRKYKNVLSGGEIIYGS